VLCLVAGIVLETQGFYLRVLISGWAPVTNMYETVIWVSAVSAVLGLVLELIYRKGFAALAGSGVALLGTVLAANVPLLDPDIKTLQPVLRSNNWLTIHVLTEVSSYGAFLTAAGLGLIGTFYYLTAAYRRSPTFTELALPVVPGVLIGSAGTLGLMASYGQFGTAWEMSNFLKLVFAVTTCAGGALVLAAPFAILGEIASRLTFHDDEALATGAAPTSTPTAPASAHVHGTADPEHTPAATSVQTVIVSESQGSEAVATLTKPSVAEIRAMAASNRPKLDARGLAMQATAAKIKPISNFIYRSMQVGVLLIAAGTILGGIWADYSWGRFWGWDPKEVWALITLLVYLIPLHGRFAGWFNTFALVASSVVCSLSVIMAWYGVNFVLGVGLHSYGFVEGGGQGSVAAVLTVILALPLAAGWRRHAGSKALIDLS
jgi:ABC-type transport system involved in cytochrome c biogenesis permease subunit